MLYLYQLLGELINTYGTIDPVVTKIVLLEIVPEVYKPIYNKKSTPSKIIFDCQHPGSKRKFKVVIQSVMTLIGVEVSFESLFPVMPISTYETLQFKIVAALQTLVEPFPDFQDRPVQWSTCQPLVNTLFIKV